MASTAKTGNFQVREIESGNVIANCDTMAKAKALATRRNKPYIPYNRVAFEVVDVK